MGPFDASIEFPWAGPSVRELAGSGFAVFYHALMRERGTQSEKRRELSHTVGRFGCEYMLFAPHPDIERP